MTASLTQMIKSPVQILRVKAAPFPLHRDPANNVKYLDLTLSALTFTAAFPRTIFGKWDRRATGPRLDQALGVPE
jgi:hypothetical protein